MEDHLNLTDQQQTYDAICSSNIDLIGPDKTTMNDKISALRYILERDLVAADLKWSLFVAACLTFKYDSCLKPFPPMYIKSDIKDINDLRSTINAVPPLKLLLEEFKDKTKVHKERRREIELLFWVLIKLGDPSIRSVKKEYHSAILSCTNSSTPVAEPNLLFEISKFEQSYAEVRWNNLAKGQKTFFACHGSRLENFYSILNYGLQQHLCQTHFFGRGIYLSKELAVSLHYSLNGLGWKGSVFGENLSCVILCEIIDHEDVKIGDTDDVSRNLGPDTIGGKVPNKYVLVLNNELLRIRYLLVYSKDFGYSRPVVQRGVLGWFQQHKLLAVMLAYTLFLVLIGLSHNRNVKRYYKIFMDGIGFNC